MILQTNTTNGSIWWIIIAGLFLLILVIWIIAAIINRKNSRDNDVDSLVILQRRYARGEISAEEFEESNLPGIFSGSSTKLMNKAKKILSK